MDAVTVTITQEDRKVRLFPVSLCLILLLVCFTSTPSLIARGQAKETISIAGQVTDQSGYPVQNCRVEAYAIDNVKQGESRVDRYGRFSLEGLEPGTYTVVARQPWDTEQGGRVTATVDQSTDSLHLVFPKGITLHGFLRDKGTEKPIDSIACSYGINTDVMAERYRDTVETRHGRFTYHFPFPEASISFGDEQYVPQYYQFVASSTAGNVAALLDARLERSAEISGTVSCATPYLHGMMVYLLYESDGRLHKRWGQGIDWEGNFRVEQVPAHGVHTLILDSDWLGEHRVEEVEAGTKELVIDISGMGYVQGQVRNTSGEAVTEYKLRVGFNCPPNVWDCPKVNQIINDPEGGFRYPVPPGRPFRLSVDGPDHAPWWSDWITLEPGAVSAPLEIVLGDGFDLEGTVIDADTGEPLQYAEVSAATDIATDVRLEMAADIADASGRFLLEHLPGGRTILTFVQGTPWSGKVDEGSREYYYLKQNKRFAPRELVVNVTGPMNLGQVEMNTGGTIEGLVRRADGSPTDMKYVGIRAHPDDRHTSNSEIISPTGRYVFRNIPEGTACILPGKTVHVISDAYRTMQPKCVRVEAGTTQYLDFVIPTGRTIRGTVTQDGALVESGRVIFDRSSDRTEDGVIRVNCEISKGQYEATFLEKGNYTVSVYDSHVEHPFLSTVTVTELSGDQELALILDDIEISAFLLTPRGEPLIGFMGHVHPLGVSGLEQDQWHRNSMIYCDSDGGFRLCLPQPGEYVVELIKGAHINKQVILDVPPGGVQNAELILRE